MRKLERNQALRDYVFSHPDVSLKEIGEIFNISASRVCRILHNNKVKLQEAESAKAT